MKRNFDINVEEAENKIDSASSAIDAIVYLITLIYRIVTGQWLVDVIKQNLK